jgi:hypothetical protein
MNGGRSGRTDEGGTSQNYACTYGRGTQQKMRQVGICYKIPDRPNNENDLF